MVRKLIKMLANWGAMSLVVTVEVGVITYLNINIDYII